MKTVFLRIKNRHLLLSILLTLFSFVICFCVNGFNINTSNDDLLIAFQLYKGYYDNIFISWFLSAIIIPIQSIFRNLDIFVCLQFVLNTISLISIVFAVLRHKNCSFIFSIIVSLIILICFSSFCFVHIQWTISSAIITTAGYVILIFINPLNKRKSIVKYSLALFLLLCSSFIRISSFLSVSAVFGVLFFSIQFVEIIKSVKINKKLLKSSMVKSIQLFICAILIFAIPYGLNILSENIKTTAVDNYREYRSYNNARASVVDYGVASFNDYKDFYKSIDIRSQNDLDEYSTWIHDKEFFTTSKLNKISAFLSKPEVGYKFSFGLLFNLFSKKFSVPIVFVITILFAVVCVLLFIFRNKIKLLFPVLLAIIWVAFFCVFGIRNENILMIPIALMSVVIAAFYNRYLYFYSVVISIISICLFTYLNFGRPIFRATFTFMFPAIVIMLLLIVNKQYIRKTICFSKTKTISSILSFVSLVLSILVGFTLWLSEVKPIDNTAITNYIKNDKKNIYVASILQCYDFSTNALLFNDVPNNVIVYGWLDGSKLDKDLKKELGIENLYKDMLEKNNIYFITSVKSYKYIEKYYKEHFSENTELECIKTFDDFGVYSVNEK